MSVINPNQIVYQRYMQYSDGFQHYARRAKGIANTAPSAPSLPRDTPRTMESASLRVGAGVGESCAVVTKTMTVMFTQPGQGAGKVAVAFPSEAVIVLFNPSVELPKIPLPVKVGGGAVNVSVVEPVVLDGFDVVVEPPPDVVVLNVPVIFVSWKF